MKKRADKTDKPPKPPLHPYLVLVIALLFPGMGQVLNGTPERGFMMAAFTVMLGWVTYHTTTPDHSLLGRYAGGIFVYSFAVMDAYRWARYRWELYWKEAR